MHAVPLESYRVLELSLPSDTAELQRVLRERVCGKAAWPPVVRHFALAAILRAPGLKVKMCLFLASENGHADAVDALLAASAAVDGRRIVDGSVPLHLAAIYGHTACVTALLAPNAAVNSRGR